MFLFFLPVYFFHFTKLSNALLGWQKIRISVLRFFFSSSSLTSSASSLTSTLECVVHRWLTDRLCEFVLVFQVSFFIYLFIICFCIYSPQFTIVCICVFYLVMYDSELWAVGCGYMFNCNVVVQRTLEFLIFFLIRQFTRLFVRFFFLFQFFLLSTWYTRTGWRKKNTTAHQAIHDKL